MQLILDHVSHIYDAHTPHARGALHDVSLQIGEGSFIGLIGHTGSGKSTLIQHLNGLLKPTEGAVYADGKDIADHEYNRRRLRGKVGLVFQYPEHQLFEAEVFQDVCFGPKNLGLSNRGLVRPGFKADLVMIDWDKYGDNVDYVHPNRGPSGIERVWVNGIPAAERGRPLNAGAGRILDIK